MRQLKDITMRDLALIVFIFVCVSYITLLAIFAVFGNANVIEHFVSGSGSVDDIVMTKENYVHATTRDAEHVTHYTQNIWDYGVNKFESTFTVEGVRGGYLNKYEVRSTGAGYRHEYVATKITGNFTGSADNVITLSIGIESFDSIVLMDGNATFRGRIKTFDRLGRPVSVAMYDEVGDLVIRSYLNITKIPERPEDWLAFCDEVNTQMPNGIMIEPV